MRLPKTSRGGEGRLLADHAVPRPHYFAKL